MKGDDGVLRCYPGGASVAKDSGFPAVKKRIVSHKDHGIKGLREFLIPAMTAGVVPQISVPIAPSEIRIFAAKATKEGFFI